MGHSKTLYHKDILTNNQRFIVGNLCWTFKTTAEDHEGPQKSSFSSTGNSIWAACSSSWFISWIWVGSIAISTGWRTGASTRVRLGSLKKLIMIRVWKEFWRSLLSPEEKILILTRRVYGGARWRAFRTDSYSWQRYRSTASSSFCGKWSAWPWPFCP